MSQAKEETEATSRRLEDVWYVVGRTRKSLGLGQWEKGVYGGPKIREVIEGQVVWNPTGKSENLQILHLLRVRRGSMGLCKGITEAELYYKSIFLWSVYWG